MKSQVHSKFKVFVTLPGLTVEEAMHSLDSEVAEFTSFKEVAPKSVSVEYLKDTMQYMLSLGYVADPAQPGYQVGLVAATLGTFIDERKLLEAAMSAEADKVENAICHEFFIENGQFVMVMLVLK
jgi:hypothetical protein